MGAYYKITWVERGKEGRHLTGRGARELEVAAQSRAALRGHFRQSDAVLRTK